LPADLSWSDPQTVLDFKFACFKIRVLQNCLTLKNE
jgi:hypothetical protein